MSNNFLLLFQLARSAAALPSYDVSDFVELEHEIPYHLPQHLQIFHMTTTNLDSLDLL